MRMVYGPALAGSPTRLACSRPGAANTPCDRHFISSGVSATTPGAPFCATATDATTIADANAAKSSLLRTFPVRLRMRKDPPKNLTSPHESHPSAEIIDQPLIFPLDFIE